MCFTKFQSKEALIENTNPKNKTHAKAVTTEVFLVGRCDEERQRSRAAALMVTDTVSRTETGGCRNREELVSQLSMFRGKFPELPDLPQPPTAGHFLDSCSLTLHGNTLSHDLWCHVFIYSESVSA